MLVSPHSRLRLSESSESRFASSGAGTSGHRVIQVDMENADERVTTGIASIGSSMKWCRRSRLVLPRDGGRTGHYPWSGCRLACKMVGCPCPAIGEAARDGSWGLRKGFPTELQIMDATRPTRYPCSSITCVSDAGSGHHSNKEGLRRASSTAALQVVTMPPVLLNTTSRSDSLPGNMLVCASPQPIHGKVSTPPAVRFRSGRVQGAV